MSVSQDIEEGDTFAEDTLNAISAAIGGIDGVKDNVIAFLENLDSARVLNKISKKEAAEGFVKLQEAVKASGIGVKAMRATKITNPFTNNEVQLNGLVYNRPAWVRDALPKSLAERASDAVKAAAEITGQVADEVIPESELNYHQHRLRQEGLILPRAPPSPPPNFPDPRGFDIESQTRRPRRPKSTFKAAVDLAKNLYTLYKGYPLIAAVLYAFYQYGFNLSSRAVSSVLSFYTDDVEAAVEEFDVNNVPKEVRDTVDERIRLQSDNAPQAHSRGSNIPTNDDDTARNVADDNDNVEVVMGEGLSTQSIGRTRTPVPSFDIANQIREARKEFTVQLQTKLRNDYNVQDFVGIDSTPNEVIRMYMDSNDKDAMINSIAKEVTSTFSDVSKPKTWQKKAKQFGRNILKNAKKQGKKLGKKALKLAISATIAAEDEYERQEALKQGQPATAPTTAPATEPEITLDDLPEAPTHTPGSKVAGVAATATASSGNVKSAMQRQVQAGSTLQQQLDEIQEANSEKPYESDMFLRPEFRSIVQDIEKLKWIASPEQEEQEELAIMDIIYVDEDADPRTHGVLNDNTENTIADMNTSELNVRYRGAHLTKDEFAPAGMKMSFKSKNRPIKERVNPATSLIPEPTLYPHLMLAGQLTDKFNFGDELNLLPRDDMLTIITVDEPLTFNNPLYRSVRAR